MWIIISSLMIYGFQSAIQVVTRLLLPLNAYLHKLGTVKSPNFVTAHNFVMAADNFCEALLGFQL